MNTFIYDKINNIILEKLEQGNIIWRKGWKGAAKPMNYVTKYPYRGINVFLLASLGFSNPYFLSFKQVKDKGGHVKKGEKSCPVIFWTMYESDTKDIKTGENKKVPVIRYYNVFNYEQCEGLPAMPIEEKIEFSPIEEAEKIVKEYKNAPELTHNEQRACYIPLLDKINMPKKESFISIEEYYSTLFHELVHSTGHVKRLNRFDNVNDLTFKSYSYSKEELVAELGSSYLCAIAGIEQKTIDNQAAYIQSWMKALRNDKTLFIGAGGKAQKAADHILGLEFNKN